MMRKTSGALGKGKKPVAKTETAVNANNMTKTDVSSLKLVLNLDLVDNRLQSSITGAARIN